MRSFILRAIASVLAVALLACGGFAQTKKKRGKAHTSSAKKTAEQPYTGDPIPPPQKPEPGDGVRRITPAEAHAAVKRGTALMVDVRNDQAYNAKRIKGAMLVPYGEVAAHIKRLPRNKQIITYCS